MRFLGYVARRQMARRWSSTIAPVVLVALAAVPAAIASRLHPAQALRTE